MDKIITIPFGYLLDWLYQFTGNYGLALIFFAIAVRLVLMPISAKSKKSTMKMSRLQPRIQEIQKKYENDKQKQNEAIQKLQQEEGASMGCGGCLWSFIPLLILIPLYSVIRQPIQYMLHESAETVTAIIAAIKEADPSLFTGNTFYDELVAARHIPHFVEAIKAAGITISNPATLEGLNFTFLGIDLGMQPTIPFMGGWVWNWSFIGAALIPLLSAGSQLLSVWLSQKANDSLVTDEKGLQDKETARKSSAAQSMKMTMWMMPLMSLWIGFTVPAALSLYWFIGGVIAMAENHIMTKHYRKVYDAEDAARLKKALEKDAIEAEKERIRAEKRAANPDGITENTSKKKLQKKQQQAEEAAKAAAKKEYEVKKGVVEEEPAAKETLSGITDRPYAKGRAYDPDRYSRKSTEE